MNFKTTIILAVIFAIGLGVISLMNKHEAKVQEEKKSEGKLLNITKEKIKEIILEPSGVHAVKDSNEWKIIAPVKTDGDKSSLDAIANMFNWAKIERVVSSDSSEYPEFGLAPEKGKLIVVHDAGSDTIYLGDRTPTNSYVFARKSGSPDVFLTTTSLQTYVEKKLFDLRDKRILVFDKNRVNTIELQNKHGKFVLEKSGGKWNLISPIKYEADETKVNSILNRLNSSRIREFVDEQPKSMKKYGLTRPAYKLDLLLGTEKAKKTLIVGKKHDGKYYAKDESKSPVFLVDSSFVKVLNVSLSDLRSKKISNFKTSDVDSIVLQFADSTLVFKKDTSNTWVLVEPVHKKTKSWKISSIASTIANLRVDEFVDDAPRSLVRYGLAKPAARGQFYQNGKLLIDVMVGKLKDDKVYLKITDKKPVYLVKKYIYEKLRPKLSDLIEEPKAEKKESSKQQK